jgi:hypothetical protein
MEMKRKRRGKREKDKKKKGGGGKRKKIHRPSILELFRFHSQPRGKIATTPKNATNCNYTKQERGLYYTVQRASRPDARETGRDRQMVTLEERKNSKEQRLLFVCMCELSIMRVEKGIKLK